MLGMFVRSWQLGGGNGPGPVKKVGDVNQMKLRYGGRGRGRRRGRSLGSAAAGPLSAPRGKATHHKCKHPELALELELEPPLACSDLCVRRPPQALFSSLLLSPLRLAPRSQLPDRIVPSLRARVEL